MEYKIKRDVRPPSCAGLYFKTVEDAQRWVNHQQFEPFAEFDRESFANLFDHIPVNPNWNVLIHSMIITKDVLKRYMLLGLLEMLVGMDKANKQLKHTVVELPENDSFKASMDVDFDFPNHSAFIRTFTLVQPWFPDVEILNI